MGVACILGLRIYNDLVIAGAINYSILTQFVLEVLKSCRWGHQGSSVGCSYERVIIGSVDINFVIDFTIKYEFGFVERIGHLGIKLRVIYIYVLRISILSISHAYHGEQ